MHVEELIVGALHEEVTYMTYQARDARLGLVKVHAWIRREGARLIVAEEFVRSAEQDLGALT